MHDAQALKPAEGQPAERAGLPGVGTGVGREGDRMGVGNREPRAPRGLRGKQASHSGRPGPCALTPWRSVGLAQAPG